MTSNRKFDPVLTQGIAGQIPSFQASPRRWRGFIRRTGLLVFSLCHVSLASPCARAGEPSVPSETSKATPNRATNSLLQQEFDLLVSEAISSPDKFAANNQKKTRFLALRAELYPPSPPPRLDPIFEVEINEGASAAEEEFVVLQAEAWNAYAEIHNKRLDDPETVRSKALAAEFQKPEFLLMNERLKETGVLLAAENPAPPPLPDRIDVPSSASPALRAYISEQNVWLATLRNSPSPSITQSQAHSTRLLEKAKTLAETTPKLP